MTAFDIQFQGVHVHYSNWVPFQNPIGQHPCWYLLSIQVLLISRQMNSLFLLEVDSAMLSKTSWKIPGLMILFLTLSTCLIVLRLGTVKLMEQDAVSKLLSPVPLGPDKSRNAGPPPTL